MIDLVIAWWKTLSKVGKWPLGLIGGGALVFFIALRLGTLPVAVLGIAMFLSGVFLTKWSKLAKATIGLIFIGILTGIVGTISGHSGAGLLGLALFGIGIVLAKIFYN